MVYNKDAKERNPLKETSSRGQEALHGGKQENDAWAMESVH
jgi:hypothetical protein